MNADDPSSCRGPRGGRAQASSSARPRRAARGRRRLLRGRLRPAAPATAAQETLFGRDDVRPARRAPRRRPAGRPPPPRASSAAAPGAIARAVRGFRGVEHVLELVATIDGVSYYNDSKATNVEAARRSLEAFDRPVAASILGGRYKGGDFADLAPRAARARPPRARDRRGARARAGGPRRTRARRTAARSLREAVARARAAALPGDVVLLAPACSSFDMFRDYADRGRAFKDEVRRLGGRGGRGGEPWLRSSARTSRSSRSPWPSWASAS